MAEFEGPNEVVEAARRVHEAGYEKGPLLHRDRVARSQVRRRPHLELPDQPGTALGLGGRPVMRARHAVVVLGLAALAAGCRQDMHDQPKCKAFRRSDFFGDERSARPFVEDTVARGQLRADAAYYTGKQGTAPVDVLPVAVTPALLRRGQERY